MSEVTSVNGHTGAVVLTAADVEAVPTSAEGKAGGVATLDGGGVLQEAQVPGSVVSSSSEEASETVEGTLTPAMPTGKRLAAFAYKIKGAATIKPPTGAPSGFSEALIRVQQDSSGGHKISTSGIVWNGGEPVWNEAANAVNLISLFTVNGGASWEAVGPQEGKEGKEGKTGPEGFVPSKLLLPKAWPIYLGTGASTTENKPVLAEPFPRYETNNVIILTSGTPVICAIPVSAKTVVSGVAWAIKTAEGTPANRTHLWAVLLDSSGKILRRSADYTSSTNSPMTGSTRRGVFWTETYETGASATILYAAICEVMSSTACMAIPQKSNEQVASEAEPILSATGPAEQTTPPELGATWAFKGSSQEPYLVLF